MTRSTSVVTVSSWITPPLLQRKTQCGLRQVTVVWSLTTDNLLPSSEQQLINCDTVDSGCNSELMDNASASAKKNAMWTETGHSYIATKGHCAAPALLPESISPVPGRHRSSSCSVLRRTCVHLAIARANAGEWGHSNSRAWCVHFCPPATEGKASSSRPSFGRWWSFRAETQRRDGVKTLHKSMQSPWTFLVLWCQRGSLR